MDPFRSNTYSTEKRGKEGGKGGKREERKTQNCNVCMHNVQKDNTLGRYLFCLRVDKQVCVCEFSKCMGIMLANLCHPYIVRTTVLTDMYMIGTAHIYGCASGSTSHNYSLPMAIL